MRPMMWLLPALSATFLSAAPNFVVDGQIDDWAGIRPGYTASDPDHLVQAVSVAADAYRVFLRVTFSKERNPNTVPMTLLADSDGDSLTGDDGFDVALEFSSGLSVSTLENRASSPVKTGVIDLELTKAPAYVARDAEIGFPRGRSVGAQNNLFSGREGRWRLIVRDESGQIVQQGRFAFRLPAMRQWKPPETEDDPLSKGEAEFRVVSWNIGNRRWVENEDSYRRVLQALQPDIVLLDEVNRETPEAWIRGFLKSLRPDGKDWNLLIAKTGGWQRSLVATYLPLTPAFDEVPHTSETIERLGPLLEPHLPKESPPRIGLEEGIGSAGAFVTVGARTVLATVLDLTCCEVQSGNLYEQQRQAETEAIAGRLGETLRSHVVDGIVVAGDFNLVGTRRPLDALRLNLDPSGGDLAEVYSARLDGWATWTWTSAPGAATRFARNQLDYMLYSPSRLEQRKAFIFDPADLSSRWRLHHNLAADELHDHMPLVTDFSWSRRRSAE